MSINKNISIYVFIFSFILMLSGCQTIEQNSRIVAGAFNTATTVQQGFLERNSPTNTVISRNIQYLQDPALHFDLYQAADYEALGDRPTIIWIHGGGWISGSKEHAKGYFKRLADYGYNVVSVEYQFAPKYIYPTQLNQINQLLIYLTKHAEQYHINPNQLYLAGDSAGANLASHYAALATNLEFAKASYFDIQVHKNQIKGLILHCGIYDLENFITKAPDEIKLYEWGIKTLVQAYTGGRKDDLEFLRSISPIQYVTSDYPAVFISSGNRDFLTKTQALPFIEQLKKNQIPVTEVFYPDSKEFLMHEYQFMMSKKASQETLKKTIQFIQNTSQ
ncbi:alpha/beta hydrolase [Acinetobacter equi]|uniref:Alpha/beta hydrolase n=1 Tax=Acinetobacter equi TaxID=1324350 RepID=A0A0N9VFE1_9GAMM|nr:alpha/beta hydrolase fold domain-containing protein [Acinetobacter equi]ALH96025.1 alpha/beta hydrolase [Acinetobacter equi]